MKGALQMQNTNFQIYRHYIALDWSMDCAAVASMRDSANKPVVRMLPADTRSVKDYLKSLVGRKILTFEETTTAQWLYAEFRDYVDRIIVCDPFRNSLLKDGPKNDKIDAVKLCTLLRNNSLKEVYHTMDEAYEIRKLVSAYDDFVKASVRFKNQRSSLFRSEGRSSQKEEILKGSSIKEFISQTQVASIEHLDRIRKEFESLFYEIRRREDKVRLLTGVSGIGIIGAVKIYAVVIDPQRFETKYKYWAYCGLAKHQKESGVQTYGLRRVRHNRVLKSVYRTSTITAVNGRNDIGEYFDHLLENNYNIYDARNEVARYTATSTLAMMKHKTEYRAYQWRETKS